MHTLYYLVRLYLPKIITYFFHTLCEKNGSPSVAAMRYSICLYNDHIFLPFPWILSSLNLRFFDYEINQNWKPEDVSANNEGYDIKSISPVEIKRYIEVKGRSGSDGSIMLSENEMNRLAQLGESSWLYIVVNCKSIPELFRIQNPAKQLNFQQKTKGIQYFLPHEEWKSKIN